MPRTGTALSPVDSTSAGVTATKGFNLAADLIGGLPELEDQIGGTMVGAERVTTAVRELQPFDVSFRDNRDPHAASPAMVGAGTVFSLCVRPRFRWSRRRRALAALWPAPPSRSYRPSSDPFPRHDRRLQRAAPGPAPAPTPAPARCTRGPRGSPPRCGRARAPPTRSGPTPPPAGRRVRPARARARDCDRARRGTAAQSGEPFDYRAERCPRPMGDSDAGRVIVRTRTTRRETRRREAV